MHVIHFRFGSFMRRKTQCETAQILGMTQVMVSRRERKLLKELREQLV